MRCALIKVELVCLEDLKAETVDGFGVNHALLYVQEPLASLLREGWIRATALGAGC